MSDAAAPSPSAVAPVAPLVRAPVIGRDGELAVLKQIYDSVLARSEVRVATIVGPAGIGKTRVAEQLVADLPASRKPRVYHGAARAQGLAYGLFDSLLRSAFELAEGLSHEASVLRVRDQVASILDDRRVGDVCYFLGALMGLSFSDSPFTRAVMDDPLQARLIRRAVLRSFFEADARRTPLCLVLDDLQNADEDSLDLLVYLIAELKGPIMLVCLARPELLSRHERWLGGAGSRHDLVELSPVSSADARAIMQALLTPCEDGPPERLLEAGLGMAGGNPGLLAHMVRIFHDSGVLREVADSPDHPVWQVDLDRLNHARLPLTVEDAVSSRLAVLSAQERRLLEHAATLGSVFWLGGLVALARMDREAPNLWNAKAEGDVVEIERTLAELVQRDYVLRLPDSALPGDIEYVFKHNLERERIAQMISPAASRRRHQTIADWLAQKDNVRSQEEYSAMLARHLELAGSLTRAAFTYIDSGGLARAQYAQKRANDHYRRGLELLGEDDARRRLDALHDHGDVLVQLGRTDEALAAFREMLSLAYRLGLKGKGGAAHNRIGRLHRDTGSLELARDNLEHGLELFELVADQRGVAASHDDIGKLLWTRGEYQSALEQMKTALDMRKELGDGRSIALSLNNIGLVWRDHGQQAQAREALEAALAIRRERNEPLGIVESLNALGDLALDQSDAEKALKLFYEAHAIAKDVGEHNRIALVLTNIGEALLRLKRTEESITALTEAEGLCDETGDRLHLAEAKQALAKAYLEQKDLKRAREAIKRAVDLLGQVRSKPHLAVALRTLGEVTGAGAWGEGHEVKAVDYFMRSIAICKEIGNDLEVARSYRAFSTYVFTSPHYRQNADIQREARKLESMAEEIFERHRLGGAP
ncbi:MAG TPA: tetratricopeptide repeat protein [Polyangiaceae bacterium]|nr:tetratricopeptide repeat protein [Polyangiaceae bacterium]